MTPDELKHALALARDELDAALAALAPKHKGVEIERAREADRQCMHLERELARSLGEEAAVEIEWPAPWDIGAPLPHVVAATGRVFVVYLQRERNPGWDGSSAEAIDPAAPEHRLIAVVEFERCLAHRFGAPNDEALAGHPLHGRGLSAYSAHTVERSRWLAESEQINSVHRNHRPETFREYTHYVLSFHDETFECLAMGYRVRQSLSTFSDALQHCVSQALS